MTDGVYDGVIYRRADHMEVAAPAMGLPCGLFVSSRNAAIFDSEVNAPLKGIWLHDWKNVNYTRMGPVRMITPERAAEVDFIFVLSEAHKAQLLEDQPHLEDKIIITANGIDPERFFRVEGRERKPRSFIYSSSPDRGLERILDWWPDVQKMWPDATLDVYYGFGNFEQLKQRGMANLTEWQQGMIERMDALDGVTLRGRVGQDELAEAFAEHQYWFYPSIWTETYCIGAVEAIAAGCTPVTNDLAALAERVPERFRVPHDAEKDAYLTLLADLESGKTLGLMKDEIASARACTWEAVYNQWGGVIAEVTERKKKVLKAEARRANNPG
jgi:glycosyltransferase involved in cell wall biosynthesis